MRISLLRIWVILRRFRRSASDVALQQSQYAAYVEALMQRADPLAPWSERANWLIDVAHWLRHEIKATRHDVNDTRRIRHYRTSFLLNWLESHPDSCRQVQATLRNSLHEALGPDIFCATGLPREPAFFGELSEHFFSWLLPRPPAHTDLSALFTAMFPDPADADWLHSLDSRMLLRLWRLAADDGIVENSSVQIDEALQHLVLMVVSVGVGPSFRRRLTPVLPLKSSPFMELRNVLEHYLELLPTDCAALSRVRRQIAICRAQTDRIYAHLDQFGVSVGLVYHVERMRAQLARMAQLIDLRASVYLGSGALQLQDLLAELIRSHHERASVRGLVRRNFSLLARKMVERNADHGEQYIARDRSQYRAMLKAACIGGVITAFAMLGKAFISGLGMARFFEGLFISINFAASFLLISACGGVLATKQPAVTAPALAARMVALDTLEGLRSLMQEIACLLRSQAAAVFGNLVAVVPTMLLLTFALALLGGQPAMAPAKAHSTMESLSLVGVTPLLAAFTGVLLWLASLAAGFADNWFALRRLREALAQQRRLVLALGALRARRFAAWLETHLATIVGNVVLAFLLGMTPAVAGFFGLPLDTRHVTLATASLTAAVSSLGWRVFLGPDVWLAIGGILSIGLLNVGVAFSCALTLALQARDVPKRVRRIVFRQVLKRFSARPASFLLMVPEPAEEAAEKQKSRRRQR